MDNEHTVPPKKKGLGRGLDALLGAARAPMVTVAADADADDARTATSTPDGERITRLPIEWIKPGRYQPRHDFDPDALRELTDSILAQGVIQPILVRALATDRYEIIAGERRWRACQQAGLAEIPAIVRDVEEQAALAIGLIENIQRTDLKPLEEAGALERLLKEFELTHQQIADALGKSRSMVTNLLRLLDLEPEVRERLEQGLLEMGHARALLGLRGPEQVRAAVQVVRAGLSVRETERLVRRLQQPGEPTPVSERDPALDPNIRRLQSDLTDRLGARVEIKPGQRGTGKLVIAYNSLDELDGILSHIK
ncbi:chromosome partitioning protein ParB [Thiocapsa imhoffii]|uniref:Probable chromosome-partitioning protein ParB n=1 Tax=Thiocapsa imhoffii TaxID=382777 RepID=A0A9X1B7J5_9GAMM|nr:ParB/RepB/Spo0J family partition protein [Thiocapsa imhoffii]MBK1643085.1 chromosome partitioning protein ParB [Thiocapsa imhoffii]